MLSYVPTGSLGVVEVLKFPFICPFSQEPCDFLQRLGFDSPPQLIPWRDISFFLSFSNTRDLSASNKPAKQENILESNRCHELKINFFSALCSAGVELISCHLQKSNRKRKTSARDARFLLSPGYTSELKTMFSLRFVSFSRADYIWVVSVDSNKDKCCHWRIYACYLFATFLRGKVVGRQGVFLICFT